MGPFPAREVVAVVVVATRAVPAAARGLIAVVLHNLEDRRGAAVEPA